MHASQFFLIFVASFITFLSIYLLRPFAISINLVDLPNSRKLHDGSIPLIGGIAMYIGIVITILAFSADLNQYNYYLMASLIIIITGVLDDHQNISVSLRLLLQVFIALILCTVGDVQIYTLGNLFGNGEISLNQWASFVSVLAIIAGINAVNMADGIHGLAGGNSLITFLCIAYLSIEAISHEIQLVVLLFCSVLPVFLIHNLCIGISKSKRIFMGDAGSMFIGLTIAWVLIDNSQGQERIFAPVTALWFFGLPLFEMFSAILRRIVLGNSPFKPDLHHLHHMLKKKGLNATSVLIVMLMISLFMALIGIMGEQFEVSESIRFFGFLGFFLIYLIIYILIFRSIKD